MAGWSSERDGARLLLEPPALLGRALALLLGRAQALQRDAVARDDVAAQVDDAHAAATELAHDLVALREDGPDLARRALARVSSALPSSWPAGTSSAA